jgi:hypothetical protein
MASLASPARDIPIPASRDSFTAVAARSVPAPKSRPLPTPPNSISPNLPPHGLKPYGTRSTTAPEHVDSDLDLQDGSAANGRDGSVEMHQDIGSLGFDTTGDISPSLLANHHLPEILLNHGPLAIRHIMGYLTTSVPGFSGIPPAKARRVVVAALESRASGGEGGGLTGNVKFEKVGWGRWDARLKGHPARDTSGAQSPPPSLPSEFPGGMPISNSNGLSSDRTRLHGQGSSWAGHSMVFSHDDDIDMMMENEADKMSLDGGDSCTSSEAPPEDEIMEDDPEDMTDDEDWAAVGAAALRATSASGPGPGAGWKLLTSRIPTKGRGPSLSTMAKSVPLRTTQPNNHEFAAFGMTSDSQEREAIEALLRLGSV